MLPNLSRLRLHTCPPVGVAIPDAAIALIEAEECQLCSEKLGDLSGYGDWRGPGRGWVVVCNQGHCLHKMCVNQQIGSGNNDERYDCDDVNSS